MTSEADQKEGSGIGFAGLSSMVSDVDTTIATHEKSVSGGKLHRNDDRPLQDHSEDQPTSTRDDPAPTGRGPQSGLNRLLGIGAVIVGFVILVGWLDTTNTATKPNSPPNSPKTERPPRVDFQPPAEQKPAVGNNLSLGPAEIRYCLSESIRLEAARTVLNKYAEWQVNRFNVMIDDYNSRCSSFRYRKGTLESVRPDVERNRSALEAQGRSRF